MNNEFSSKENPINILHTIIKRLTDVISDLENELDEKGKWVNVEERLPTENTEVITYESDGFVSIGYRRMFVNNLWFNAMGISFKPTHWMPLPAAPKDTSND